MDDAEITLAAAVAAGDPAAIREFETRYLVPVRSQLRAMNLNAADIADIEQTLRVRLLVGEDGAPARLVQYAGQGKLGGLVRVAAVREALTMLRRKKTTTSEDWLEELSSPDDDPELVQLKSRHRVEFKAAFEEAVRRLSPREHTLLRLHLVRQHSIDHIGAVYGVHRATAARWIEAAKRRLRTETSRILAERFELRGPDLERVVALIESRIELSIDRLLATSAEPPAT
ncbi:MAG: sigma-70 family RNA polymerase sigma factor [Myxococcales bacterium]|nr:sigma-70 family RNA polymerase sigma factor [Myxococcales bacterium]